MVVVSCNNPELHRSKVYSCSADVNGDYCGGFLSLNESNPPRTFQKEVRGNNYMMAFPAAA